MFDNTSFALNDAQSGREYSLFHGNSKTVGLGHVI